jgi:hypothetical protein
MAAPRSQGWTRKAVVALFPALLRWGRTGLPPILGRLLEEAVVSPEAAGVLQMGREIALDEVVMLARAYVGRRGGQHLSCAQVHIR